MLLLITFDAQYSMLALLSTYCGAMITFDAQYSMLALLSTYCGAMILLGVDIYVLVYYRM